MLIRLQSDVDPKSLRTNLRYTNITKVPPIVKAAATQLTADVSDQALRQGWSPDPDARLAVDISFMMNDRRADVDSASKRVIDCIAAGLGTNDSRFDTITLRRGPIGTPGVGAVVWTLDKHTPAPVAEPTLDGEWSLAVGEYYVKEGG